MAVIPLQNRGEINMDWAKIKTIFIIAFLALNIYLGYEFYKLYKSSQYDYISEATIESQLSADEIEIVSLPKNVSKGKYLTASPKRFTKEELAEMAEGRLNGQSVTIINDTVIESYLEKPYKISANFSPNELAAFLKNNVIAGEEYSFWERDPVNNTITYYQKVNDKVLFNNMNGELTFYLNEDNEIVYYRQTLLEDFEEFPDEETLLQPIKAIEILYENGKIPSGSKITKIEEGYYTLVHLSSSQVLTPVWRVVLNGEKDLYVNAVEGQIVELENVEKKILE